MSSTDIQADKTARTEGGVNLAAIPNELQQLTQWGLWRYANGTKMPFDIYGEPAKSNDPSTWANFEAVTERYAIADGFDGIAFFFSQDDEYCGIDLDGCRDPDTGEVQSWAEYWIDTFATYTEISPSATGFKLTCKGRNTRGTGGNKKVDEAKVSDKTPGVEIYDNVRFWTFTGWHVPTTPTTIEPAQSAIDEFLATYWAEPNSITTVSGTSRHEDIERCWRYVQKMPDAISGNRGHDSTFAAACKCFQFGLTDAEALEVIRRFNASKTGGEQWNEKEMAHKLKDAREKVTAAGNFGTMGRDGRRQRNGVHRGQAIDDAQFGGVVINGEQTEMIEVDTGKPKPVVIPLSMEEIIERTKQQTDDWPRRVDTALFVHDDEHGIGWLHKAPELFGWLHRTVGRVEWHTGNRMVRQTELLAELQRTAQRYIAVETLPHEPMIGGHYYACDGIEPGDGSRLQWLLDRFCPATDIDRDLILAALLTPMWGGPPGARPAFVITSDDGRGAGKSTLAEMVGAAYEGVLQFSHLEDIGKIKTRLLSPEALPRRVALLDNIKSLRFSWGELEAMITATIIGGHRMYVGEATRPNTLVWFITLNGAALSCDLAQRSVIIKIKKPERTATWHEETRQFIRDHQHEILGDIIAALRKPAVLLGEYSRWASWEKDVLQRLPEPSDAQTVIMERQGAVDVDEEEAGVVEDYFADQLLTFNYDSETAQVFIPSQVAARWWNWCQNDNAKVVAVSRMLGQMIDEKRTKRLKRNACRSWGRGFVWIGTDADVNDTVRLDLEERISRRND